MNDLHDAFQFDASICSLCYELIACDQDAHFDQILSDQLFETLGMLLIKKSGRKEELVDETGKYGMTKLYPAIEFIEENLDTPLSIEKIADAAGLPEYHVFRAFKHAMKMSPYQYVLKRRLDKSKRLLSYTDKSATEIAYTCGFPSPSNFFNAFKQAMKITPLQYREKIRL